MSPTESDFLGTGIFQKFLGNSNTQARLKTTDLNSNLQGLFYSVSFEW
jgi:hypothetical protein